MLVPGVSTRVGSPARQRRGEACGGLRLDGDDPRPGRRAPARRGRGERSDAGRDERDVDLLLDLGEERGVAVDDPVRRTGVADVGDLGDARRARPPPRPARRPPRRCRRRRRPPRPPPRSRRAGPARTAPGGGCGAASPRCAATCATARPWLPALAATSVWMPRSSRSVRSTAQDAPSTLKAGSPRRSDSSFRTTDAGRARPRRPGARAPASGRSRAGSDGSSEPRRRALGRTLERPLEPACQLMGRG